MAKRKDDTTVTISSNGAGRDLAKAVAEGMGDTFIDPDPDSDIDDTAIDLAAETMTGDLRDFILDRLKHDFAKVRHTRPMLSLDKVSASDSPTVQEEPDRDKRNRAQDENTLAELRAFDATIRRQLDRDKVQYIIEPKVDGVSISVHYRHGKLALGVISVSRRRSVFPASQAIHPGRLITTWIDSSWWAGISPRGQI